MLNKPITRLISTYSQKSIPRFGFFLCPFKRILTVIQKSSSRLTSRALVAVLRKKESQSEYWPRLTKEKLKTPFIKTDFSKWADEDEQDGNPTVDDDFGAPGGIPGMDDGMDLSKVSIQSLTCRHELIHLIFLDDARR